jgi:hypothetical protein
MYINAEDAHLFWCPFTQIRPSETEASNERVSKCLGPHCAAWRWKPASDTKGASHKGFCGLAGKPQVFEDS